MVDININLDTKEVNDWLKRAGSKAAKIVQTILKKSIFIVERYAKYYSPVKTGRMRASITEGIEFGETQASIGPTVNYAKYVHARIPFMWAARASAMPDIEMIINKEVENIIK